MDKLILSSFFLFLFTVLISGPTIILMVDDSIDTSIFYSITEEEEKGHESVKKIDLKFSDFNQFDIEFNTKSKSQSLVYTCKKYSKPHLNLLSPPPEQHI